MTVNNIAAFNTYVSSVLSNFNKQNSSYTSLITKVASLEDRLMMLISPYPEKLYDEMFKLVKEIEDRYFSKENKKYETTISSNEDVDKLINVFSYDLIPVVPFVKPMKVYNDELGVSSLGELYEFLFKFLKSENQANESLENFEAQLEDSINRLKVAKSKDIFGDKKPLFKKEYNEVKSELADAERVCGELEIIVEAVKDYILNIKQGNAKYVSLSDRIMPFIEAYRLYHTFMSKSDTEKENMIVNLQNEINNVLQELIKIKRMGAMGFGS